MTATMDKAKISGITGLLGAIATYFSSFNPYFLLAGFGLFFLTLLIQYGSLKFKFVTSFVTFLTFAFAYISQGGTLP